MKRITAFRDMLKVVILACFWVMMGLLGGCSKESQLDQISVAIVEDLSIYNFISQSVLNKTSQCLQRLGYDELNKFPLVTPERELARPDQVGEVGSGLVAGHLARLDDSESTTTQPIDVIDPNEAQAQIKCEETAREELFEEQPGLKLHSKIRDLYYRELEIFQEEDYQVRDDNKMWVDCMELAGFEGFSRPGDQFEKLGESINMAYQSSNPREELQKLLELDIKLGVANQECLKERDHTEARIRFDEEFAQKYRAELLKIAEFRDSAVESRDD